MTGFGNIITIPHKKASGSPFTPGSAFDGTSIEAGKVVLGQAPATAGNPGMIIDNREIPIDDSGNIELRITNSLGSSGPGSNVMAFFNALFQVCAVGIDLFGAQRDAIVFDNTAPVSCQITTRNGKVFSMLLGHEWLINNTLANAAGVSYQVMVRHNAGGATDGFVRGVSGASGSFTTVDGKTVTVVGGIITSIV